MRTNSITTGYAEAVGFAACGRSSRLSSRLSSLDRALRAKFAKKFATKFPIQFGTPAADSAIGVAPFDPRQVRVSDLPEPQLHQAQKLNVGLLLNAFGPQLNTFYSTPEEKHDLFSTLPRPVRAFKDGLLGLCLPCGVPGFGTGPA